MNDCKSRMSTNPWSEEFLGWLWTERACSISTRNQRLAAIHAFFRYVQAEANYNSEGDFVGYYSMCSTCWDNFHRWFNFGPCKDAYCVGNGSIDLKGSTVAGHYQNLSKKPDWVFRPLRCKPCRDWLANVKQTKRQCSACGRPFIFTARKIKWLKKFVGDPEQNAPEFCPSCAALSATERANRVAVRRTKEVARKRSSAIFRKGEMPGHRVMDSLSGGRRIKEPCKMVGIWAHNSRILHVREDNPTVYHFPFELVKEDKSELGVRNMPDVPALYSHPKEINLQIKWHPHLTEHLTEFRPPETPQQFVRNSKAVLQATSQEKVVQLVDCGKEHPGRIVKVELETGRCVIADPPPQGNLVTSFPITRFGDPGKETYPSLTMNRIGYNISIGKWRLEG